MVILVAIFVLMTLLILYGSNNVMDEVYAPFHVATNHALKATDLKKWSGREGYVPVYGNKVLNGLHTITETDLTGSDLNTSLHVWKRNYISVEGWCRMQQK